MEPRLPRSNNALELLNIMLNWIALKCYSSFKHDNCFLHDCGCCFPMIFDFCEGSNRRFVIKEHFRPCRVGKGIITVRLCGSWLPCHNDITLASKMLQQLSLSISSAIKLPWASTRSHNVLSTSVFVVSSTAGHSKVVCARDQNFWC